MIDFISKIFIKEKTVNSYMSEYLTLLSSRDMKPKTVQNKIYHANRLNNALGKKKLSEVKALDVIEITDALKKEGKLTAARDVHSLIADFFQSAIIAGYCESSPTTHLKTPQAPVRRKRLSKENFLKLLDASKKKKTKKWLYHALLLTIITGQRRHDISNMRFDQVFDGYLHIKQQKTGTMIALPIELKLDLIGMTISDVIELCKKSNKSDYLLFQFKDFRQVQPFSLSAGFCDLYREVFGEWEQDGFQPSFHEIRSLSERLYREQGIDTQTLLGHKKQSMTDVYNDDRGLTVGQYKKLKIA